MAKMCYRPVLGSTVNGLEQPITVSNSNNSISSEISQSNANTQSILPLSNEHETNVVLDFEFLISFSNRENNRLVMGEDDSVNIYNKNSISNTSLDINESNDFVAALSANSILINVYDNKEIGLENHQNLQFQNSSQVNNVDIETPIAENGVFKYQQEFVMDQPMQYVNLNTAQQTFVPSDFEYRQPLSSSNSTSEMSPSASINHFSDESNCSMSSSSLKSPSSSTSTTTIPTYPSWFQSNAFGYPNLNKQKFSVNNQQFSNLNGKEMNHDYQQVNSGSLSKPVELNQQILYPSYCDATQSSSSVSNLSANDSFENTKMITPINNYPNSPYLLNESNEQLKNKKVHNESKPITVLPKKRETIKISRNSKSIAQNAIPMISNTDYYNMPIRTIRKHGRNVYHIYDYVMEIFYNPGEIARRIRSKDPNKLKELEDLGLEIDKLFLWLDQEKGIFKVLQPEFVSFIWAFIKKNRNWCWKRFLKSIQLRGDFKIADMDEGYGKWHVLQFNRKL